MDDDIITLEDQDEGHFTGVSREPENKTTVICSDHQLTRCLKTLQDISEVYLEPQWIADWSVGSLKLHKYLSYNICDLFRNPILRARLETSCGSDTGKIWVPEEVKIPITAQLDPSTGAPSPGVCAASYTVSLTGDLTRTPFHTAKLTDELGKTVAQFRWKNSGSKLEVLNQNNDVQYFLKTPHPLQCASSPHHKVQSSNTGETIGTFEVEPTSITDRMYGIGHITTVFPKNFTWKDKIIWIAFITLFEHTKVGVECAKPTVI